MTDKDVIDCVASMFGVKTFQFENGRKTDGTSGKKIYSTAIHGNRAANFMRVLLPYMGNRRSEKIKQVLEYHESKPDPNTLRQESAIKTSFGRRRDIMGRFLNEQDTID